LFIQTFDKHGIFIEFRIKVLHQAHIFAVFSGSLPIWLTNKVHASPRPVAVRWLPQYFLRVAKKTEARKSFGRRLLIGASGRTTPAL
jgi:hypothetical protein